MGVFGFLRKGGKKAEKPRDSNPVNGDTQPVEEALVEVKLDDVMKAIEGTVSSRLTEELKKAAGLYGEISHGLEEARKHAAELEKKKFESGDKTYAVVNMTKDHYVKRANSLISGAPRINNFNFEETSAYCEGTKKILNELLNIPPKQAILLTRYFKKESSKLITTLKQTEAAFSEMEMLLNSSMLGFYSAANRSLVEVWQMIYKSEEMEDAVSKINAKIGAKKAELSGKENAAKEYVSGEESRAFVALDEEIRKLESERMELGNVISDRLSAIKRPLKKLEHAASGQGEKDKEKLSLYSRMSHSPMKVLMQEQGDALLLEALAKIREVGLKDEERELVEEMIKKIELGYLSELTDKYKWLETEVEAKKKEFEKSHVPEKQRKHDKEIEAVNREISELGKEAERISKNRAELSEKIRSSMESLEHMILKEAKLRIVIVQGERSEKND
jgi:hypothetical protein